MQGLFVGDDQTPAECLKRDLKKRLDAPVEILNTGHLGYSPEQYYYTLLEYAGRFPPHFVVISIFANDFGEYEEVLHGKGDWDEGSLLVGAHPSVLLLPRRDVPVRTGPMGQSARRTLSSRGTTPE